MGPLIPVLPCVTSLPQRGRSRHPGSSREAGEADGRGKRKACTSGAGCDRRIGAQGPWVVWTVVVLRRTGWDQVLCLHPHLIAALQTQWVVSAVVFITLILRHDLPMAWCVVGAIASSFVNKVTSAGSSTAAASLYRAPSACVAQPQPSLTSSVHSFHTALFMAKPLRGFIHP